MADPLHLAFLGCGFITAVHSRHLAKLRSEIVCSYASRDAAKADEYCRRHGGIGTYSDYIAAIEDPRVDAVAIAVPPRFHLDLALRALAAGKHVLVEKPAFPASDDFAAVAEARDRARKVAGNVHVGFRGVEAEALLVALDHADVYAAAGSSCSSGATEPSHVLHAMGVPRDDALASVRVTLGASSTDHDVDVALSVIPEAVARLRAAGVAA